MNYEEISIEKIIQNFSETIDSHWNKLNQEGIWLFLALLGCWGVTNQNAQILAVIISFLLFIYNIYFSSKDWRSFNQIAKDIEKRILEKTQPGDYRDARLFNLGEIKSKKLSWVNTIKSLPAYILSSIFLVTTILCLFF